MTHERIHIDVLPEEFEDLDETKRRLADFWNQIPFCEDSGGTTWDVIDEAQRLVTDLLDRGGPEDIRRASRETAEIVVKMCWSG